MRISKMFFKTYKEDPQDAEIKSHKLMVRAGYIKKQTAGVYMFMPLGLRVLRKLCDVIREEMDNAGACEMQMTSLLPIETYSGRLEHFGSDMFRLQDRSGKEMCLGPSHEEVFTAVVKDAITSYKQLPQLLYQIQTKFRDEVRPRFGLMRGKEFLMKDAYSYDVDKAGLDKSYNLMAETYKRIFNRLGLKFVIVNADNGSMGGSASQEFMVKSSIGEDEIIVCDDCGYASNIEKAECVYTPKDVSSITKLEKKLQYTPNLKTISDLVEPLNKKESDMLKAVVYKVDDKKIVAAFVPGDREIEEIKLLRCLGGINIEMASPEDIESIGSVAGFVGAIGLKNCTVVADNSVKDMVNFIIGANKLDYHYENANLEDLHIDIFADIKKAKAGDICPNCGKVLQSIRGIEVGHIFKQNTKYTEAQQCKYLDVDGKSKYMEMGAYGIGVTRTMSAIIEQNSDDLGIILPDEIAPYKVEIVIANIKNEDQVVLAEKIYNDLLNKKVEVLLDDRQDAIGAKLKDAELIGVPYIVVVGKNTAEGKVELINRHNMARDIIDAKEIINKF